MASVSSGSQQAQSTSATVYRQLLAPPWHHCRQQWHQLNTSCTCCSRNRFSCWNYNNRNRSSSRNWRRRRKALQRRYPAVPARCQLVLPTWAVPRPTLCRTHQSCFHRRRKIHRSSWRHQWRHLMRAMHTSTRTRPQCKWILGSRRREKLQGAVSLRYGVPYKVVGNLENLWVVFLARKILMYVTVYVTSALYSVDIY